MMSKTMRVLMALFGFSLVACQSDKTAFAFDKAEALVLQMHQYPKVEYLNLNFSDRLFVNATQYDFPNFPADKLYQEYGLTKSDILTLKSTFRILDIQSFAQAKPYSLLITDSFQGDVIGYLRADSLSNHSETYLRNTQVGHFKIKDANRIRPQWWVISGTH